MSTPPPPRSHKRLSLQRGLVIFLTVVLIYFVITYLAMPLLWKRYEKKHPSLSDVPNVTKTGSGIPADPLNVALIGTKEDLVKIMLAAKWYPADPLSLKSCLEIAEATVFKRSYDTAPVSSEYLFGRKEDFAFEQPVGNNPRERHHVRFWKTDKINENGKPVWIGSAVFDKHVGISSTTGQITHITGADVDAERDFLFQCLEKTGHLIDRYTVKNFHTVHEGKNGEGDPWKTDGDLYGGVIEYK